MLLFLSCVNSSFTLLYCQTVELLYSFIKLVQLQSISSSIKYCRFKLCECLSMSIFVEGGKGFVACLKCPIWVGNGSLTTQTKKIIFTTFFKQLKYITCLPRVLIYHAKSISTNYHLIGKYILK